MNQKVSVNKDIDTYYDIPTGLQKSIFYKLKRKIVFDRYRFFIKKYLNITPKDILEIGSGPGILVQNLKRWFPDSTVIGLEYDERLVKSANQRLDSNCIIQGNAETFNLEKKFDVIICLHVIEHLYEPKEMLKRVHGHLNDQGIFIIATPNLNSLSKFFLGDKWQGFRDDHVNLKSSDDWSKFIIENGFILLKQGTTLFSGIPIFKKFPLSFIFGSLLWLFKVFPWNKGESYIGVWGKSNHIK